MNPLPLYREARVPPAQSLHDSANLGLYFNKFPNAWQPDSDGFPTFDPPSKEKDPPKSWLTKIASTSAGDKSAIGEACDRLFELIEAQGGVTLGLRNTTRFVTGMGLQHPTGNGFNWHPTLGVPYLPGTGVKGLLASWCWESIWEEFVGPDGEYDNAARQQHNREFNRRFGNIFGLQESVGGFIFTDLLPVRSVSLAVEIMTPHYGDYYGQSTKPDDRSAPIVPGDWMSPVPISYLAVAADQRWMCAVVPRNCSAKQHLQQVADRLLEAFEWNGAGAKTNAGAGSFVSDNSQVDRLRAALDQKRRAQAERVRLQHELATCHPQVATLLRMKQNANWKHLPQVKSDLDEFIKTLEAASEPLANEAVAWLRQNVLEVDPKYKGMWNDPEKKKGKKNDKWTYTSEILRELTLRLRELVEAT